MNVQYCSSPLGQLRLVSNGKQLTHIEFEHHHTTSGQEVVRNDPVLRDTQQQLTEYFHGRRTTFDLPLAPQGTAFQEAVWQALQRIPFGETRSYADIASQIMRPKAVRAVGAANGRNPIPLIVPCHRVIGSDGTLTGFAGGLHAKKWLLGLEGSL